MKNLYDLYCIDVLINDVKTNSKEVVENDLFVCTKGVSKDRHEFIDEAIKKGASCLVVSRGKKYPIPYVKVKNPNKELVTIVQNLYSNALKMKLIAVTGTDGKTTTASILRDLLGKEKCGYIGTNGIVGKYIKASCENTTPALETIYKYLNRFYEEKLQYASIEASSEGMLHHRLDGLTFSLAIFTNFTEDHLNVHKSKENYLSCKRKVFRKLDKSGFAILNRDDPYYKKFRASSKSRVFTYGKNRYSKLRILSYEEKENKSQIVYSYQKKKYRIESPLHGEFNVYNLSAAISAMLVLGYTFPEIRKKVLAIKVPFGRCEFMNYQTKYQIVLDYAHTENGIFHILSYLKTIKKNRLITVTGSAGGREKEKRKKMGKVAQKLSDIVIYTMDDPRYEKVMDIIHDLIDEENKNYWIEPNRKRAIYLALNMAEEGDIVAILGKGRDNYMAIEDKKVFYSDVLVLEEYFKEN